MRFRRDDRRGVVAVAAILADPRLAQLTALACKAQSTADLDVIGLQRAALIVEHCEAAGLRRVARGGGSSSSSSHSAGPCRQAPLLVPRDIAERHSLPEQQRALRQASQAAPGSLEHWQARQTLKAARKAARREAAERLEQQAKEEPEAFYKRPTKAYRGLPVYCMQRCWSGASHDI